jgi:hypothetical protein
VRGVTLDGLDVSAVPREELPALLGRLTELEARCRLRLAEAPAQSALAPRVLTVDEAVDLAAAPNARWLLGHTRGLSFRRDLSRKAPRFDEAGLRRWLADRRRA